MCVPSTIFLLLYFLSHVALSSGTPEVNLAIKSVFLDACDDESCRKLGAHLFHAMNESKASAEASGVAPSFLQAEEEKKKSQESGKVKKHDYDRLKSKTKDDCTKEDGLFWDPAYKLCMVMCSVMTDEDTCNDTPQCYWSLSAPDNVCITDCFQIGPDNVYRGCHWCLREDNCNYLRNNEMMKCTYTELADPEADKDAEKVMGCFDLANANKIDSQVLFAAATMREAEGKKKSESSPKK
eukprot:GHVN01036874.1.p1 GENE.GHVN01036874.1~~GHVN01036874.1.p1  ORF type:complete len:239 (-),score=37.18 GHVN01036874.1:219-935(-)